MPKAITPAILELCKKIDDTQTPVFVPVKPVALAIVDECYHNVRGHVEKHGGSIQHGWIIWEHPEVIIEGNFHACWLDAVCQFVDITPKRDGEKQILFLPDSKRVYDGTPVDNVREILTKDPALIQSFKLQEDLHKLRAKYNVDGKLGRIPTHELKRLGLSGSSGVGVMNMIGGRGFAVGKVGRNDLARVAVAPNTKSAAEKYNPDFRPALKPLGNQIKNRKLSKSKTIKLTASKTAQYIFGWNARFTR
jgi:hypothetical protein